MLSNLHPYFQQGNLGANVVQLFLDFFLLLLLPYVILIPPRCVQLLAKEHAYKLLMPAPRVPPTKRKPEDEQPAGDSEVPHKVPKGGKPKAKTTKGNKPKKGE